MADSASSRKTVLLPLFSAVLVASLLLRSFGGGGGVYGALVCRECRGGSRCKRDQGTQTCTISDEQMRTARVPLKCIAALSGVDVEFGTFSMVEYFCPSNSIEAEFCLRTYDHFVHEMTMLDMCCDDADLCNGNLTTLILPTPPANATTQQARVTEAAIRTAWELPVAITLPVVIGLVFLATLSYFLVSWYRGGGGSGDRSGRVAYDPDEWEDGYVDGTLGSISTGVTGTHMEQVTIAKEIQLDHCIGKGRYGEVWHGKYRGGTDVAVKIFSAVHDRSFFHEVGIYQTTWVRNPNVLGFIAADNRDDGSSTQLWMVTDYCHYGSLYDYIVNPNVTLTIDKVLKLAMTASRGLCHLHSNVTGALDSKPAMAHRDVKSRNFLVRRDGTTCIADLGLSIRESDANMPWNSQNSLSQQAGMAFKTDGLESGFGSLGSARTNTATTNGFIPPTPFNYRVGTRRYMAPEILNETMRVDKFDSFRRTDIYSFALVLWEVCCRANVDGVVMDYEQPYQGVVPSDPDIEDMRQVVVVQQCRPAIPPWWRAHRFLSPLATHMEESWCDESLARSPMARLQKKLEELFGEAQAARRESRESAQALSMALQELPSQKE